MPTAKIQDPRFVTGEVPSYCDLSFAWGYQDPYPLSENLFLVSYGGEADRKNRIYLVDDHGNRKCIHEAEGDLGCWYPMPAVARERPPVIPERADPVAWEYRDPEEMNADPDDLWGTLLVQDVYRGVSEHIRRGEAKFIQVIEQVQKSRCMAGGEAWGHTPIIGRGTTHVRRLIGLVPIEEDGSAYFTVPALRSVSFNSSAFFAVWKTPLVRSDIQAKL